MADIERSIDLLSKRLAMRIAAIARGPEAPTYAEDEVATRIELEAPAIIKRAIGFAIESAAKGKPHA